MAYTRTNWSDRAVQYPNRYTKSGESSTEVTLVASPGTVTQAGTLLNAANMNNLETGVGQALWYGATTNSGTAFAVTLSPAPTAYYAGMTIRIRANADNSLTTITINVNGLGAKAVKKSNGDNVTEIKSGSIYTLVYNGTDFILQGEGGDNPWIGDWSAYTPVYNFSGNLTSTAAGVWFTALDVSGYGGYLMWCRGLGANTLNACPDVRITIDGQVYNFTGNGVSNNFPGKTISQIIPFKSSIKIEVKNIWTSASGIGCDYLILRKTGSAIESRNTLLSQSARNSAIGSTSTATYVDVINITGAGYILDAIFTATGTVAQAIAEIIIDGVTVMTNRILTGNVSNTAISLSPYFNGPIRFNSSLIVRVKASASNSIAYCTVGYSLD